MSNKSNEINDNEIRIISAYEPEPHKVKRHPLRLWCLVILSVLVFGCLVFIFVQSSDNAEEDSFTEIADNTSESEPQIIIVENLPTVKGFTIARDTIIDKKGLLILSPENARPRLIIGTELLNDSNIVLAAQAADVRRDNGQIAGTFVLNGELISKGEAKAGYCSIINGELSIGIADATPMLEQTLTEGGYFFRQYPLVVGGQIVENKPKGKAIRKALAEIGGKICVVMSTEKLTFHDFSQLLINAGARNAIYLVGSSSYGFYINENGEKILAGKAPWKDVENVSYIIWEQL